jgi:hypothetical protein
MRTAKIWGRLFLLLILLAGLFWVAYTLTQAQNGMRDSDFFSLWAAGRLLGSGINPYNEVEWLNIHEAESTVWISDPTFLYPLPLALLFVPFGFLSLQQASILWLFLSQFMILLSIYLCSRMMNWDRWGQYFLPLLVAALLFRAVLVTIRNGQLGAFLLFIISLGLYALSRKKAFIGGLALGLLFLKPPITGLFLVVLILWFLIRKSWRAVIGIGVSIGSLIAITTLLQPHWIGDWLMIGTGKALATAGTTPTLWGLTAAILPHPTIWFWTTLFLSIALMGAGFFLLIKVRSERQLLVLTALLLPLSLFVTPYLWAYDHILLLIPAVVLVAKMDELQMPFILNSSLFLFFDVVALVLLYLAYMIGNDRLSGILPIIVVGITIVLFQMESKRRDRHRIRIERT